MKLKLCGYEMKQVYENEHTGARTFEVNKELLFKINNFYEEILKKPLNPLKDIRGFKEKSSTFRWKTGVGYDLVSKDLLGGTASGEMRKTFESYMEYKENSTELNLKKLNIRIENINKYDGTKLPSYEGEKDTKKNPKIPKKTKSKDIKGQER